MSYTHVQPCHDMEYGVANHSYLSPQIQKFILLLYVCVARCSNRPLAVGVSVGVINITASILEDNAWAFFVGHKYREYVHRLFAVNHDRKSVVPKMIAGYLRQVFPMHARIGLTKGS